jgi:hypothetical protein
MLRPAALPLLPSKPHGAPPAKTTLCCTSIRCTNTDEIKQFRGRRNQTIELKSSMARDRDTMSDQVEREDG